MTTNIAFDLASQTWIYYTLNKKFGNFLLGRFFFLYFLVNPCSPQPSATQEGNEEALCFLPSNSHYSFCVMVAVSIFIVPAFATTTSTRLLPDALGQKPKIALSSDKGIPGALSFKNCYRSLSVSTFYNSACVLRTLCGYLPYSSNSEPPLEAH